MNKRMIAIDPGAVGGIVTGDGLNVIAYAMPETETDVVNLLKSIVEQARFSNNEVIAVIEKVGGYAGGTGQPGSAMFEFGKGAGIIYGCLMYAKVRIEEITPQKWQKGLSLGNKQHVRCSSTATPEERKRIASQNARYKTEWKNKLKAEAQRLYPSVKVTLKTSDALLIYEYAKRFSI